MFKKILFLLFTILLAGVFAFVFHPEKDDSVVLQFASWGSESEINILKPILKDFENKNPGIKINFMHIPQNYFQKIHLLFASNTAPDVIFINNLYLPVYANAGVLEDLDNYKDEFNYTDFYPKSLNSLSYNGKTYAIPRDISNIVVYYNKDLFRKNGVKFPDSGWDFTEFLYDAKAVSDPPDRFGVSFDETPLLYLPYLTTCGGWNKEDTEEFFNENVLTRESNKKGLEFYADLRNKYHVAPKKEEIGSATSAQMFLQGRLGMQISGRWLVPKYREEAKFDWDVAEFPACFGQKNGIVPMDASGWAISKSSGHKIEAVKFIKFLSSKDSIEKFTSGGLIMPARIDVSESGVFLDGKKPLNAKAFVNAAKTSVPTPVTVNYNKILDSLKTGNEYLFNF